MVMATLISNLQWDPTSHPHYFWRDNQLRRKEKLVIGHIPTLKEQILNWMNTSSQGGHSGVTTTLKRLSRLFFWLKMKKSIS